MITTQHVWSLGQLEDLDKRCACGVTPGAPRQGGHERYGVRPARPCRPQTALQDPRTEVPTAVRACPLSPFSFAVPKSTNDATRFRSAHPTLRLSHTIASCLARIYSGDADGCVPYVGTEEWTRELGFQQLEAWRPWLSGTNHNETCQNCVTAGYVTTYSAGPSHNFTFLTIKGAGHSASQPLASCLSSVAGTRLSSPFGL